MWYAYIWCHPSQNLIWISIPVVIAVKEACSCSKEKGKKITTVNRIFTDENWGQFCYLSHFEVAKTISTWLTIISGRNNLFFLSMLIEYKLLVSKIGMKVLPINGNLNWKKKRLENKRNNKICLCYTADSCRIWRK